jgi:hypothetical protein
MTFINMSPQHTETDLVPSCDQVVLADGELLAVFKSSAAAAVDHWQVKHFIPEQQSAAAAAAAAAGQASILLHAINNQTAISSSTTSPKQCPMHQHAHTAPQICCL